METLATATKDIVLIDMDGVAADFETAAISGLKQHYPDAQPYDPLEHTPSLYVHENYPPEFTETIWSIINQHDHERHLPLIPNVIEGCEAILQAGYEPRFCSTLRPTKYSPFGAENKLGWIREHFAPVFGEWIVARAIFTDQKYAVNAAVLIEDRPAPLTKADEATWEHVVFDQPYNRNPESQNLLRINGWNDPELIPKINKAHQRHLQRLHKTR